MVSVLVKERAGNNFLISSWRFGRVSRPRRLLDRRSPAGLGVGDLRSAKWQGQETLPQLGLVLIARTPGSYSRPVPKSFGGAPPALVFPRHRRVPGREVAQQGPGTTVQSASLQRAVQVLALIEVAVHASHQSVKHVARAVAAGVAVGNRPAVALATQVQDLLQDDPCEVSGRPLAERAQALCKTPAVGRVIGIPNPP